MIERQLGGSRPGDDNIPVYGDKRAMRETASLFKALSDETRLRTVTLLTHGELCVCDIMEVLGLPQSTVSRHLSTLRQAGLVEGRRQGVWNFYRLVENPEPICRELLDVLSGGLGHLDQVQSDRRKLGKLVADKENAVC